MITKKETKPSKVIDIIQSLLLILLLLLIFAPDSSQSSKFLERTQKEIKEQIYKNYLDQG